VFPVAADCRRPLTPHGCKDASADDAIVRRLWSGREDANIALATGSASGVWVLDVDVKDGKDGRATLAMLQERHGALPQTWVSCTPSGGQHRFFAQPPGRVLTNRVNVVVEGCAGSGLDVRATGASVALPPSTKGGASYRWEVKPSGCPLASAPAWLLDVVDPPAPLRLALPHRPIRAGSLDRLARYGTTALDGECAAVAGMSPGSGRNQALFQASARLGELVGAGVLPRDHVEAELEDAASACGLIREDGLRSVKATIQSGLVRGLLNPREIAA
jgi:hypothetical protein